jgi:hypothetical protein
MRRVARIVWHLVAILSLLALLATFFLAQPQTTRHTIGSTEFYSLLETDNRLIVDVHDRHGWWNLMDRPLWALWLAPAILLACWLLYPGRRWAWTRRADLTLIGSTWVLFVVAVMWLPVVIFYDGLDQVRERSVAAIVAFMVMAPFAFPTILVLRIVGRALDFRARRQRRRIEQGLCVRCGYSLMGNVSGVCPECGSAAHYPD